MVGFGALTVEGALCRGVVGAAVLVAALLFVFGTCSVFATVGELLWAGVGDWAIFAG